MTSTIKKKDTSLFKKISLFAWYLLNVGEFHGFHRVGVGTSCWGTVVSNQFLPENMCIAKQYRV